MRILYVIGSLAVGGAEQHLLRVSRELTKAGFEAEVFALTKGGPLTAAFEECGVRVHGVTLPTRLTRLLRHPRAIAWTGLLASAFVLWRLYWRRRPDVVHYFLPAAYIVGGVVALFGPRTLQIMSRRSLNHYQAKHHLFAKVERWLHPQMDLVTGNSKAVVTQLMQEGISPARARLIYNGIDTSVFHRPMGRVESRGALHLADDVLVMVMVANLIPYKGHADLLNALGLIKDRLPEKWVMLLAGRDDGLQASLSDQAKILGLSVHIKFLGSRSDVPQLLMASDVGVLCSHEEGFSNAVLEGMAAALPMVVTDVGGNAEAVVHGETGLVVPAKAPQLLADAILTVVNLPHRREMGQLGRKRVQTLFSMDMCIEEYQKLYGSSK